MIPAVMPTYSRAPLSFVSGEGSWLIEADGRRFLDLGGGIAVAALGHAHPALVAALTEQAGRLWHTSNLYRIPAQEQLAAALVEATFADTVFFTNSGAEAMEMAIKVARKFWHHNGAPERHRIVTFDGAFHGRTLGTISAAGGEKLTRGFGPLLPGFTHLAWGDHDALRAAAAHPETAAILIEPIQGEGGIRPLPQQCLTGLRALCDEHGLLLILDEIQCGMGRTGRLFAHEAAGVAPDIMAIAKGIGGGFPLGACLATESAAAGMTAGTHGSTYGGNPLACAVGSKVLEIVTAPGFLSQVAQRGDAMRAGLEALVARHPGVLSGVRGAGLMLGLGCVVPNTDMVEAGYAEGVLTVPGGDNVVRLLPPLTLTDADLAEGLDRLDRAATRCAARAA
ncbi:MAG: aspartate aminotransferase family protein [Rhodobacteraceae bacterium]|nr:aspartate aminotransferase family protein [Paracoccaceae bacterium]